MNSDNFDSWYDGQKEKIMQKYSDELTKGTKKDVARENFKRRMLVLHKKYNDGSEKALKQPKIFLLMRDFSKKFAAKSREAMTFLAENFGDEQ